MEVRDLIKILLDESSGIATMQVKLDGAIPIPLEEAFKIEAGKSWVLFKKIKVDNE